MTNKNIQYISNGYLCSACGACNAICPKDAISFKWSSLGRLYAHVNTDNCVNCGMCLKVCPSIDTLNLHSRYDNMYVGNIINTYTGRATDDKIYRNAQSGGACTAIIKYLFDAQKIDGAIMCRMTPSKTPSVNAVAIDNVKQLYECQKSCYTFVDVLSALKQVKDKKTIAIVGVPCHIEGATLLSEQFRQFTNIKYKIGLICDRTQCKGMQDTLVSLAKGNNKLLHWRKKAFTHKGTFYNYQNAPCVVLDGKEQIKKNGILPNSYRFVLKNMFTAPRCRVCYDKLNVHADIVLGDPWGMSDIDWKYGESLVLTRTALGESLIQEMIIDDCIKLKKRNDFSEAITGQHIDTKPQETEKYQSAYNRLFHCECSYLSENTSNYVEDKYIKEFELFVKRENKTEPEIQKEAYNLIKTVNPQTNLFISFLKRIKRAVINCIR